MGKQKLKKKKKETDKHPPIVTVLGHVDHGKTTILDNIRGTDVQEREEGGITQGISVFTVKDAGKDKKEISFIDTPGHEAFNLMRQRGGSVADIVLLVVAANDGVKPQTKESIEIIKNSDVATILVINKCDLPGADVEKVKREVSTEGLMLEGMGGEIPVVEVSGKTGKGVDDLLDMINLVAEVTNETGVKSLDGVLGVAVVLESVMESSRGNISTVIVTKGKFQIGNLIVYRNEQNGAIVVDSLKGFMSDMGKTLKNLTSHHGGKIIGLSYLLKLSSTVLAIPRSARKKAEEIYTKYEVLAKEEVNLEKGSGGNTEENSKEFEADKGKDISGNNKEEEPDESGQDKDNVEFWGEVLKRKEDEEKRILNVIIKCQSKGMLQAVKTSLDKIEKTEDVELRVQKSAVGDISQTDVSMAEVSDAIILGFKVSVEPLAQKIAEEKGVLIRNYSVIYKLITELGETMEALESGGIVEKEIGSAKVKQVFILSNGTKVLGGRVEEGVIRQGHKCYIVRDDEILSETKIMTLKQKKEKISEARDHAEFGATFQVDPGDVQKDDMIFCYEINKKT